MPDNNKHMQNSEPEVQSDVREDNKETEDTKEVSVKDDEARRINIGQIIIRALKFAAEAVVTVAAFTHELVANLVIGPRDKSFTVIDRTKALASEKDRDRKEIMESADGRGNSVDRQHNETREADAQKAAERVLSYQELKDVFKMIGVEAIPAKGDHVALKDIESGRMLYNGKDAVSASKQEIVLGQAETLAGALYINDLKRAFPDRNIDELGRSEKAKCMLDAGVKASVTIALLQARLAAIDKDADASIKNSGNILCECHIPDDNGCTKLTVKRGAANHELAEFHINGKRVFSFNMSRVNENSINWYLDQLSSKVQEKNEQAHKYTHSIGNLRIKKNEERVTVQMKIGDKTYSAGSYTFDKESDMAALQKKLEELSDKHNAKIKVQDPEKEGQFIEILPAAAAYTIAVTSNAGIQHEAENGQNLYTFMGEKRERGEAHMEIAHMPDKTYISAYAPKRTPTTEKIVISLHDDSYKSVSAFMKNHGYPVPSRKEWEALGDNIFKPGGIPGMPETYILRKDIATGVCSITEQTRGGDEMRLEFRAVFDRGNELKPDQLTEIAYRIDEFYRREKDNDLNLKFEEKEPIRSAYADPYRTVAVDIQEAIMAERFDDVMNHEKDTGEKEEEKEKAKEENREQAEEGREQEAGTERDGSGAREYDWEQDDAWQQEYDDDERLGL